MTVYHINKGIGRASSGIEYAQAYRNRLLAGTLEQAYLFLDYLSTNVCEFTHKLGFTNEEVLWIYGYLAGQKTVPSSYPLSTFEAMLDETYSKEEKETYLLYKSPTNTLSYRVWVLNETIVDRVDELVNNQVVRVHHYSDRLTNSEHYSKGTLLSRVFYTPEGKVAYRQYYTNREITLTTINGKLLYGRNAFYQEFFHQLQWTSKDVVVLDRNLNIADAVFPQLHQAKVIVVVHAEHFNEARSLPHRTAWNNYYEYVFTNAEHIDQFVVSTQKQAEVLREQFAAMNKKNTHITVIPVGYIERLPGVEAPKRTEQCQLMTASRIADEKHIDTLIHAVVEAKKQVPNLKFFIYGEGKKKQPLQELVKELEAESYIEFMGHRNLEEEYPKHDGYLSGSTSEGFGLTILEALSYGLPIVGLDVPYGNQEMVVSGTNGFLVAPGTQADNAKRLAQGICSLFSPTFDEKKSREYAQQKAKDYLTDVVKNQWLSLLSTEEESH